MGYPRGRKYTMPRDRAVYLRISLAQQKPLPDEGELRRLYFDDGLTMEAIAIRYGVVKATISNRFRFHGIRAKAPGRERAGHLWTSATAPRMPRHEYTGKSPYIRLVFHVEKRPRVCVTCGSGRNIVVHHVNENRADNSSVNLQVLCKSCHIKHHDVARFLPLDRGWSKRRG